MKQLLHDLDALKRDLLELGAMVETEINFSMQALHTRNLKTANKVISRARLIDKREVYIEEQCLKILALHQPVAGDLRFIVAVLKVNNDLERMGDFAVNIAQRAQFLIDYEPIEVPTEFTINMSEYIRMMVSKSLTALVEHDLELAKEVIIMDDKVDDINKRMYEQLQELMKRKPETIERAVQVLSTSRYMERIADLATNIAEDVIFMVDGAVIRHQELI